MSVMLETKFTVVVGNRSTIELSRNEAEELFSLLEIELKKSPVVTQVPSLFFGPTFQRQAYPAFAK